MNFLKSDWYTYKYIKDWMIDHNDPIIFWGKIIDQRIKDTLGITG